MQASDYTRYDADWDAWYGESILVFKITIEEALQEGDLQGRRSDVLFYHASLINYEQNNLEENLALEAEDTAGFTEVFERRRCRMPPLRPDYVHAETRREMEKPITKAYFDNRRSTASTKAKEKQHEQSKKPRSCPSPRWEVFKSISCNQADLGILRLPARICELRQDGHFIKTIMREVHNRFGEKTRVANYVLEQRK